jgi:hypothetical protein
MSVEIPLYQHVPLSHTNDPFNGCIFIGKDIVFQVIPDVHGPCIRIDLSIWILRTGVHGVPVTPMILGRLQINRAIGTASFEVLVSFPSPGLAGRAVDRYSYCSKTPLGTRAHVEAFVGSSLVTVLLLRGICCRSRTSKSFSSFYEWSR